MRQVTNLHDARKALLEEKVWAGRFDIYDYRMDGEKLERWFLKTLINYEVGTKQLLPIGVPGGPLREPPSELVEIAFGQLPFKGRAGLYYAGQDHGVLKAAERITYGSLIAENPIGAFVIACRLSFFGLQFFLCLHDGGLPASVKIPGGEARFIYHIKGIDFDVGGHRSQHVQFTWQ
jgi:hypothetical protein